MGTLSLWVVLVAMTPKCYDVKLAEYMTCEAAQRANPKFRLVCQKPQEIQGASFFIGRPVVNIDGDASCFEVTVSEMSKMKFKKYSVVEWNKKSEAKATAVQTLK